MLAPAHEGNQNDWDVALEEDRSGSDLDDQYEEEIGYVHPGTTALDPKSIPSTMGLSFFVNADDPQFEVCVTWARYNKKDDLWTRMPLYKIFKVGGNQNKLIQLEEDQQDQIRFHYNIDCAVDGIRVSMFIENCMRSQAEWVNRANSYVFQPQIRVLCDGNTRIVPGFQAPTASTGNDEADLIYKDRPFLAKGHLTSALWQSIDPEADPEEPVDVDDRAAKSPPFRWVDGDILPEEDRVRFSPPDVRTEYVPTCHLPAPALEWEDLKLPPVPDAGTLADMYEPASLKAALCPMVDGYKKWIKEMEQQLSHLDERLHNAGKTMVCRHKDVHQRIIAGIELLSDDNVRLAFCFANKVIDQQRLWAKGVHMRYRPFQLAFILTTLESVVNPESPHRHVCDLLWVPTGTGKTEAYLAVAAMILAYRRLTCRDKTSGAGVSVITRYTLRLLTIQQFRRTLYMISAAEYLRVYGLGDRPAGWRPAGCTRTGDFLWGTTPFSAGLWVGESLTPNGLTTKTWREGRFFHKVPGAIDKLTEPDTRDGEGGKDPAQVTECPACSSILAIPEGILVAGKSHTLHWVVHTTKPIPKGPVPVASPEYGVDDESVICTVHKSPGFFTLSVKIHGKHQVKPDDVWRWLYSTLKSDWADVRLCPAKASRPGYFIRKYKTGRNKLNDYDFDIVCPNPTCPLRIPWMGGSPQGKLHGRKAAEYCEIPDSVRQPFRDSKPEDVLEPFQNGSRHVSDRVPIKAFTVDEQVYREVPSVVVATVDKFARLPFKPETAALFGNVSFHDCIEGYMRDAKKGALSIVPGLAKPDLIIQDELHLLEGPLGSMVGAYESAVDFLSSDSRSPVKYVASTATTNNPKDHVRSIMNRDVMLFPPRGINGDRFFIRDRMVHHLDDTGPGRLYAGVCCPGRGPLTPMIRIWARLAQTAHENRDPPENIDRFWTLAGYFNSIREMAGLRASYAESIPEWLKHISDDQRILDSEKSIELSSRTGSTSLPTVLDALERQYGDGTNSPDALFTTSMFGTGVDVSRLGLMLVGGQPKTTTSYIQATGRVGRQDGALVVTFFKASRPRDLNHYEFFARHHMQMHRFVETSTSYPFASKMLYNVFGPVSLGMLRNMRTRSGRWGQKNADAIKDNRKAYEFGLIQKQLLNRALMQPKEKRPSREQVLDSLDSGWDKWLYEAENDDNILFVDYRYRDSTVVLEVHHNQNSVFSNVPQSLRELEDETGFQVS